ncbi:MAG: aminotransferase class I/II-fold pyridoxal phosphate-dependent enzyme [Burkholderiales bacterium]|nr:aminotransferase class I/II-fold pyridoxal phosphate-dependent enzyme [Burkholderiales bacterium]
MNTTTSIVASRLGQVKPSASIAAKAKADTLRAAGREIIDFTLGEPDFPTPAHIVKAGSNALLQGHTRYTASAGTLPLRNAIIKKLQRENELTYALPEIVAGSGAKHIIFNAFTASLNAGDEVIIPAPYWVSYPEMVLINGGVPKIVDCPATSGFKLTPFALEKAITPRTRWLVLNSPNNPTGAVYSEGELRALGEVLLKYPQVWVMTDEIYEHFVYGGARHVCILNTTPGLRQRTLVINGVSKAYAMTGWRIGYGAGPAELVKAITLLITQSTTCATSAAQVAAVEALNGPQECVAEAAKLFQSRRDRLANQLSSIDGIACDLPPGAFYVFASVASLIGRSTPDGTVLKTDLDVANYFIEQAGVVTIDGASYGLSPYLRVSFATATTEIDRGCAAISAAVAELRKVTHSSQELS